MKYQVLWNNKGEAEERAAAAVGRLVFPTVAARSIFLHFMNNKSTVSPTFLIRETLKKYGSNPGFLCYAKKNYHSRKEEYQGFLQNPFTPG